MKWFSLLYQGDVHPSSEEKVIRKEDFGKLVSADEILEKARKDGKDHLERVKKECEILRKDAEGKGFQEGLEKLNEHILHLDDLLRNLRIEFQKMVLPIALKAAKRIVSKELEIFPETIVDIVAEALQPVAEKYRVTVYVNKEEKEVLDKEKPRLKEILQNVEAFNIQEKEDIQKGGCIIQTEGGMINATIENQWAAIERAFDKYKPST